ncbi:MAG: TetR/AcrR family transcriptional regulator, partial [Sphingomonadales bacterium]
MDRLSPRERRQSAILDAAESLFLEQGYERTSLAEIVKTSGGSLATLYELFGNKQG